MLFRPFFSVPEFFTSYKMRCYFDKVLQTGEKRKKKEKSWRLNVTVVLKMKQKWTVMLKKDK